MYNNTVMYSNNVGLFM